MNKEKKKEMYCKGCRNNYYNQEGNSLDGECWSLETAEVVKRKKVHINKKPPWDDCPVFKTLDCYHEQDYVFIGPDRNC